MNRVIFSIYIDIPKEELDWQPPYRGETESKNDKAKREFALYFDWLTTRQREYAASIGVDYVLFEADDRWFDFKQQYQLKYPFLTTYNIVNFYKIHLMYLLAEKYDQILYLDLDAVPVTSENFFEAWNLNEAVAILKNDAKVSHSILRMKENAKIREMAGKPVHSIRSPVAKYWNCYALLETEGHFPEAVAYNTGIVGISKKHLHQLNYFEHFDYTMQSMCDLKYDTNSMYPLWIQELFGWDNETVWAVKMATNNVPKQWLEETWHYFMDHQNYIPQKTNIVHIINKEFKFVKDWYEKNRL